MLTSRLKTLHFLAMTLLLGSLTACGSSAAVSGPRVVVMPISGNESAEEAVSEAVGKRYELVSERRYAKTARKLDAKSQRSKDIRKVSRKLKIDALVLGEFVKKGRKKYELRLTLHAGDSGEEFDAVVLKLKSKKLKKRDLKKMRKKLYAALAVVDSWKKKKKRSDGSDGRGRRSRASSKSSKKEMARARKMREREFEKMRGEDDDDWDDDQESDQEKRDRKRAEKELREEEKLAQQAREEERRERDRADEADDDDDDDDDDRSKSSEQRSKKKSADKESKKRKKEKKKSKKKKKEKDESFDVITVRDKGGQALDDEDPF